MTINLKLGKGLLQRLKSSVLIIGIAVWAFGSHAHAVTEDQAKRIYERLTGNIPTEAMLAEMLPLDGEGAAYLAIDNDEDHSFYNVTLKNWASPWTNRDFDAFADLNDYSATVIGYVRDSDLDEGRDFRGVLYDNVIYVGKDVLGLPSYLDPISNAHYQALEEGLELSGKDGYFSLKDDLEPREQSSVITALAGGGASGVITSRAGARAFLVAGTNRAAFRFTLVNHLCMDLEQVHDVTRVPDRIRQDVSRSPGGDSRIFQNTCIGCHSGMDPLAQALAYHNYAIAENDPTGENGRVEYTPGNVQPKYFNNNATFPPGFITPDDSWANYWREGKNSALGWAPQGDEFPGSGRGASSMFKELAHTKAFAQCHVERVFKTVCLRTPHDDEDVAKVGAMVDAFQLDGNMKAVFAGSADHCKGGVL